MSQRLVLGCMSLVLGLANGCALQQEQVENQLQQPTPINCATAQGDLRMLRSEKADVAQRIIEGATAIYPAGAVMGVIAGVEGTKVRVAIGEYNAAIDKRIAEIQQTCGVR